LKTLLFKVITGNFYLLHGRYQEALDCYQIATELQPDNAIYIANAGYARLYLRQLTAAVLDLEKAIGLDPDMAIGGGGTIITPSLPAPAGHQQSPT
jgi:tetratricopeptide (TPR) repeat protein